MRLSSLCALLLYTCYVTVQFRACMLLTEEVEMYMGTYKALILLCVFLLLAHYVPNIAKRSI